MGNLRLAFRSLRKSPLFFAVSVVSLAIAIAAITAVAALTDAALFRPLPGIARPDRLVSIYHVNAKDPRLFSPLSWPDFEYYRDHARSFSGLIAYLRVPITARMGGAVDKIPAELVNEDYFRVLGVVPVAGRDFSATETEPVVVIGERLWRDRFAASPAAIGQALDIAGRAFTIVGVAPAAYRGVVLDWGDRPAVWIPMRFFREAVPQLAPYDVPRLWGMHSGTVSARLRDDVDVRAATAEIAALAQRIDLDNPERARELRGQWNARAMPLAYARFWPGAREQIVRVLTILLCVAAAVLLTSCSNVASLLLTRASQRQRDIVLRFALGANARDIARMLLAESAVLLLAACIAGTALALALVRALGAFPKFFAIPLAIDLRIDARVLAFTAVVGAAVAVIIGLAPLRQTLRTDLIGRLRASGGAASAGSRLWTLRSALTAAQVALALALLVEAGLFVRTFRHAAMTDPFLRAGNVLIGQVETSGGSDAALRRDLAGVVSEVPGVAEAAVATVLPMSGMRSAGDIAIDERKTNVDMNWVSDGFFDVTGAKLIAGRDFDSGDRDGRPRVAIVNERMARSFWTGNPLGRTVRLKKGDLVTVVGVVRDYARKNFRAEVPNRLYFPIAQGDGGPLFLVARSRATAVSILPGMREAVHRIDRQAGITGPQTLDEYANVALAQERLVAWCLGALSAVALILSVVGLYGTISYSVAQRTSEIGLRIALGGTTARVVGAVLRPAALTCAAGVIAGSLICLAAARFTTSLLFGVASSDMLSWTIASAALLAAGIAAAAVPALRASRVDPSTSLRAE